MSQRLMLTALKSARLNGVPFGIEERKKKKQRWGREREREKGAKVRGEEKRKKIKTN